jgi:hypothetical protein
MCKDFDRYDKLRQSAWEAFDARRGYEWKMCFSVWAGLIALIGFSSGEHPLAVPCFVPFVVATLVPCLHTWFQANIARVNQIDIDQMHDMHGLMLSCSNREFTDAFKARFNVPWALKRWSHLSFVALTIGLSTLCAVLLKSGVPPKYGVLYFALGIVAASAAAASVCALGKVPTAKLEVTQAKTSPAVAPQANDGSIE